ncbi:MAG: NAD(P)-dependent oxidoreductase [Alphaproteobacteria bacterium]|nr:NAD(P)-dependent oxidoreductase [Alphaproteobacteria bacterium]
MTTQPAIGFIGLGLMGQGFTRRLAESGFKVTGYDIAAEKVKAAAAHGVAPAASPAAVAAASDIVLVCVTSTNAVREAVFGSGGIVEASGTGKVLVDHSTTEVEATKQFAADLLKRSGMKWVDAPVSGGPGAAASGSLAIMAGGDAEAIRQVELVMAKLAAKFTPMGDVGAGQITKLINQVLVLTNYCVIAEAIRLGEKCGIDVAKIPEALATGHAGSNLLKDVTPRLVDRDFAPRGYVRQVLKDLDMVHDLAKEVKAPTPMASQAASLFRLMVARGHSELDACAVMRLYLDEPV